MVEYRHCIEQYLGIWHLPALQIGKVGCFTKDDYLVSLGTSFFLLGILCLQVAS